MAGKDAPDFAGVFQFGLADFQIVQGNSLAIKHAIDVMVWLNKEFGGIGEGLVLCEPRGLRMPMRAHDRQPLDALVERSRDAAGCGFGWKQTVFVNQHVFKSQWLAEKLLLLQ